MPFTRLPIDTLSGGVGRQAPTKRLISEAENIDNCLVTLEKSVEKRPPLSMVSAGASLCYLDVANVVPPGTLTGMNTDNLYFHFLDIDGYNRYCIIINRAGYPFDPHHVDYNTFQWNNVSINLSHFLTVYRIEPTVWTKETVDTTAGVSGNTSGFTRGVFEYLTYGNKAAAATYNIGSTSTANVSPESIEDTFGSTDFDVGMLLWNKLVPLDFLPDRQASEVEFSSAQWQTSFTTNDYIHSGDVVNYKASELPPTTFSPPYENLITDPALYWTNVRDDIRFFVDQDTLEEDEIGQNVDNFGVIPQFPATEVYNDVTDVNGYRAWRMLEQLYDNPRILPDTTVSLVGDPPGGSNLITMNPTTGAAVGMYVRNVQGTDRLITAVNTNTSITVNGAQLTNTASATFVIGTLDWATDQGHITSSLPAEDRDVLSATNKGLGKIYYARNPYLTFPSGFYRATRYTKNPYFERVRSEGPNSVMDFRRFPLIIYKDTASNGNWRVKHMPLFPRRAGTSLSNPGPKALERKETIQSMAIWKNRLWIASENTIFASRSNSFFNFWVDDVHSIGETDPIDIQASVGAYNRITHIVPFQSILFALSSGSVQFEVRGGNVEAGISPFNVEFRPTSFFSTSRLVAPQKMANNVFFLNAGKMYMYLSGSTFNDEYSTSMDISTHCRGYLPQNVSAFAASSAVNALFAVDKDIPYHIYLFNFRTNGEKIVQQAYHRWILSPLDNIKAIRCYEKDIYLISKRNTNPSGTTKALAVYFGSLEPVPVTAPMLDWLAEIEVGANLTYAGGNTTIQLPYYEPGVNYVILSPEWGDEAYTTFTVPSASVSFDTPLQATKLTIPGNYTAHSVYVGRSYLMNIELSEIINRSPKSTGSDPTIGYGVLNMKRMTTRHFNTGNYDVVVNRHGRVDGPLTFHPLNMNSILSRTDNLLIDTVGEHFTKILSYSNTCKIYIQSAYPTPCNISNIEIIGNYRQRNTSIE
jgi:hypothetical protein